MFRVYELADGAEAMREVPTLRGEPGVRVVVKRRGRVITAKFEGATTGKAWKLQLAGVGDLAAVEGGTAAADPLGVVITPKRGARTLRAALA